VKVLITGGTGFVGPHVVRAVADQGHDLKLLVRDSTRSRDLPGQPVVGEMTNTVSLQHAVEGVDAVVHLVAIRQGQEEQFKRVMERGTRDLVAAAKDAGVKRFVLMSALGTGEDSKDLVPYYHGKWEMEQAVKNSGLEHVIFRPSFVFGPDGGILPTFRKLAKLTPVTPIIGSGSRGSSRSGSMTWPRISPPPSTNQKPPTGPSSSAAPTSSAGTSSGSSSGRRSESAGARASTSRLA